MENRKNKNGTYKREIMRNARTLTTSEQIAVAGERRERERVTALAIAGQHDKPTPIVTVMTVDQMEAHKRNVETLARIADARRVANIERAAAAKKTADGQKKRGTFIPETVATLETIAYKAVAVIIDGEGGKHRTTGKRPILSMDSIDAHAQADSLYSGTLDNYKRKGYDVSLRVYADTSAEVGIMRGAIHIAHRTAENGLQRTGGNALQQVTARDLRIVNARSRGCADGMRLMSIWSAYGADAQEYISIAMRGILEAKARGLSIAAQYHAGYLWLNRYITEQRKGNKNVNIEWIRDNGGDLVSLTDIVASIIYGGDKWTPTAGTGMDEAEAAALGNVIYDALATLSESRKRVAALMMQGHSVRTIADKMRMARQTAQNAIDSIRKTVYDFIKENAPEYTDGSGEASIDADAMEAKIAEAAAHNRKTPEFWREYRAKRKALKVANNAADDMLDRLADEALAACKAENGDKAEKADRVVIVI